MQVLSNLILGQYDFNSLDYEKLYDQYVRFRVKKCVTGFEDIWFGLSNLSYSIGILMGCVYVCSIDYDVLGCMLLDEWTSDRLL